MSLSPALPKATHRTSKVSEVASWRSARIYFGRDGHDLVILLGGGTKRRQQHDIEAALHRWTDYKRRRKEER
jgi:putative addiction module killer protein